MNYFKPLAGIALSGALVFANGAFAETTTYVDENGDAVAIDTVKAGEPTTVYYTQDGDVRVASKVVIKRSVTTDSTL